jgi:hypothetical protein
VDIHICNHHILESITKQVSYLDSKNVSTGFLTRMYVPKNPTVIQQTITDQRINGRVGINWLINHHVQKTKQVIH